MSTLLTVLQAGADLLGDHDPVVDQHAQRDDQRSNRHPLKFDIRCPHYRYAHQHGHRHERADDEARSNTQKKHNDHENDYQRLQEIGHRSQNGCLNQGRLVGGIFKGISHRQGLLYLPDLMRKTLAELDRVDTFSFEDRDTQDNGGAPVVVDRLIWRIDVAARYAGEIA